MAEMTATLRKTALNATHRAHKAKMVDFGGWDMPVEYSGLIAEHMAVRTGGGRVRCVAHGRYSVARAGVAGGGAAALHERCVEAGGGAGALLGDAVSEWDVCG